MIKAVYCIIRGSSRPKRLHILSGTSTLCGQGSLTDRDIFTVIDPAQYSPKKKCKLCMKHSNLPEFVAPTPLRSCAICGRESPKRFCSESCRSRHYRIVENPRMIPCLLEVTHNNCIPKVITLTIDDKQTGRRVLILIDNPHTVDLIESVIAYPEPKHDRVQTN